MSDTRGFGRRGSHNAEDGERLPWLEPAEMDNDADPILTRKWVIMGGVAFVVALAATVGFIYTRSNNDPSDTVVLGPDGQPPLITPPQTAYRTRPTDPGGMKIEGEGQMIDEVAQGQEPDSNAQLASRPEEPVIRPQPEPPTSLPLPKTSRPAAVAAMSATPSVAAQPQKLPEAKPAVGPTVVQTAQPKSGSAPAKAQEIKTPLQAAALPTTKTPAPKVTAPKVAAPVEPQKEAEAIVSDDAEKPEKPKKSGYFLQLGAFSTTERAQQGWSEFSQKYGELKGLSPDFQPVSVGSKTMYRLRASGLSSQPRAEDICAKLKAKGQACIVAGQ